jgi:excisionase family DNA binding protein
MDIMKTKEVAELLNVSENTVRAWTRRRVDPLPKFTGGSRVMRFRRKSVEEWVERQELRALEES